MEAQGTSVDATHVDGLTEMDVHSLLGFGMGRGTKMYYDSINERPFIISRSTYAGSGKFVQHWLGDNWSTWPMLKYSINGVFQFNSFGIPVVGADICGFLGLTNAELCARWYAVGAFYPFARNHNDIVPYAQEPFVELFNVEVPGTPGVTYRQSI